MGRRFRHIGLITAVVSLSIVASADDTNARFDALHGQVNAAGVLDHVSGRFSGTHIVESTRSPLNQEELQRRTREFKEGLWSKIRNGAGLSNSELRSLRLSGFDNASDALNDANAKKVIEEFVNIRSDAFRRSQELLASDQVQVTKVLLLIDGTNNARKEQQVIRHEIGGRAVHQDGQSHLDAVNPNTWITYSPLAKSGIINKGSLDRPSSLASVAGVRLNPMWGGRPFFVGPEWSADQIVAAEDVSSSEGDAIKVSWVNSAGTALVAWVLPDKGYQLHKSEVYLQGVLTDRRSYSDYRRLASGEWYWPARENLIQSE